MDKSEIIKNLNDEHRQNIPSTKTIITSGVNQLGKDSVYEIIQRVRYFSKFTNGFSPYGENDMGSFVFKDEIIYFKIDYFDKDYRYGSEDPSDKKITSRVLTIMLASEH